MHGAICHRSRRMSALPSKADIGGRSEEGCFTPRSGHPAFVSTRPSTTLADFTHAAARCISIFGSVDIAVEAVERRVPEWRDVRQAELAGAVDRCFFFFRLAVARRRYWRKA